MRLANLFAFAGCCTCAIAQQTIGQTDVYYDSGRNVVYSVASTTADYNTQYWYTTWATSTMFNGGNYVGIDSQQGTSTYLETPATPGYEVVVYTTHIISALYYVYEVNYSCTVDCYDWYDAYGYQLINNGGNPSSEGPTWTNWTWNAPVIYASVVSQIVVDQQSGGRFRPSGTPYNFDVRLRSFIPPLYVTGPESYCIPYPYKSVLYNGNDRNYDPWSAEYKGHQSVTLVPAYVLAAIPVNDVGITRRYASDALYGSVLKVDTVFHDCYLLDDVGLASNSGMYQIYGSPGSGQESVQFYGSITNPLTPEGFTPSIDWNVSILVNNSNPSAPTHRITGWSDCFPGWEAYIGNQQIWGNLPMGYDVATITNCLYGFYPPAQISDSGPIL
jgi:hypothetical protein